MYIKAVGNSQRTFCIMSQLVNINSELIFFKLKSNEYKIINIKPETK